MTPKEKLEHEIKVLEEAKQICADHGFAMAQGVHCQNKLYSDLKSLETPEIWEGCLGRWKRADIETDIRIYSEEQRYCNEAPGRKFEPLPIEVILKHLSGYVKGAVAWKYWGENSIAMLDKDGDFVMLDGEIINIPAPYREDWEGIGGEL